MADQQPEFRSVGAEIICHPDVADDIARQLREAVADILEQVQPGEFRSTEN